MSFSNRKRPLSGHLQAGLACLSALASLTILPDRVHACGGGFGRGLDVLSTQTIAISHRDGEEQYIFRPGFCAAPAEFGLVLPLAGSLTRQPELVSEEIIPALAAVSAPEVVADGPCVADGGSAGGFPRGIDAGSGTTVVGGGRVDIFEWAALSSTDQTSLTRWLDENGFPYDQYATAIFKDYIARKFQFLAFKVAAGEGLHSDAGAHHGSLGGQPCRSFGPIRFAFQTPTPIVPLRIAASHSGAQNERFVWDIFVAASSRVEPTSSELWAELLYAGTLDESVLSQRPVLSMFARAGERLTRLQVSFVGSQVTSDLTLRPAASQDAYRARISVPVGTCSGSMSDEESDDGGGCRLAPSPVRSDLESGVSVLAVACAWLLRRRRAAGAQARGER